MTQKMLAAFLKSPFKVQLREVDMPEVQDGWVLLKVKTCGICGSDVNAARAGTKQWKPFGHEIAGVVAKVGKNVSTVKEGDQVVLESGTFCGRCDFCRNGRVDLCNDKFGFTQDGTQGFAEYMLAPEGCLIPFDGLDFEVACLAEPLGVAVDMIYTAGIGLGDEVLILGLGVIGLMAIPLADMQGAARIYAANRSGGKRVQVARQYGADDVFLTAETPLKEMVFRTGGVDRALVSAVPKTLPDVMQVMNYGGIISYIGFDSDSAVSFDANAFHVKKLQLRASFASPALYLPLCLQLMKDEHVDGRLAISHVLPLEKIADALQLLRDEREQVTKIVITC